MDSGIGQATAVGFAREGADVVVNHLEDKDGTEHTCEQVEAAGRRVIVVQADVSDEDQVGGMFDKALEEFSKVDIPMNNARLGASVTEIADPSTEVRDRTIKTSVYGYFSAAAGSSTSARGPGTARTSTLPPSIRRYPGPPVATTIP